MWCSDIDLIAAQQAGNENSVLYFFIFGGKLQTCHKPGKPGYPPGEAGDFPNELNKCWCRHRPKHHSPRDSHQATKVPTTKTVLLHVLYEEWSNWSRQTWGMTQA